MNCNEEYVIKAIGKIALEFNFNWEEQRRVRDCLYYSLNNYEVLSIETAIVKGDIKEKALMYIKLKKLEGLSDSTLRNYSYELARFSDAINKPVATITTNDIRFYLANLTGSMKEISLNSVLSYLKSFFKWLETEEIIPRDPTRKLNPIKTPKRMRNALTYEELEKIRIACISKRERALLEVFYSTGCRISEVINMNISEIKPDGSINVIGKGNKERIAYINPKAKVHLDEYLNTRIDSCEALFVGERKPYKRACVRNIQKTFNRLGERAGLNKRIHPHLIRHTMATQGLKSGANITVIQHLLGHEDPATTQIYAKLDNSMIKGEYDKYFTH